MQRAQFGILKNINIKYCIRKFEVLKGLHVDNLGASCEQQRAQPHMQTEDWGRPTKFEGYALVDSRPMNECWVI